MGQGVSIVTGDYSRGASGFWVENAQSLTRSKRSRLLQTCATCLPASSPWAATSIPLVDPDRFDSGRAYDNRRELITGKLVG
jgi:hypothetical protein